MKVLDYFAHGVTVVLLALAGVFQSPAFAYAAVLALLSVLAGTVVTFWTDHVKTRTLPQDEAFKRKMVDLEARVSTIEFGIKQRGF